MWYKYSRHLNSTLCSWIINQIIFCTAYRRSTTVSLETKPIYSYVVNYNACRWWEAKSNQNILNRLRLE